MPSLAQVIVSQRVRCSGHESVKSGPQYTLINLDYCHYKLNYIPKQEPVFTSHLRCP